MSFITQKEIITSCFAVIAVLTMLLGVFGAATQFNTRKILGFHIVSQIGYIVLALAFFTKAAFAAGIFYLLHHIVVKSNLFFISGAVRKVTGHEDLSETGGLLKSHPWLAVAFIISGFSLGGIPPLSGFFAKLSILKVGIDVQAYVTVAVGLFVGLLTLYSMTKIWAEAFWKEKPQQSTLSSLPRTQMAVILFMAMLTLMISFFPSGLMRISEKASEELLSPQIYIQKVLNTKEPI